MHIAHNTSGFAFVRNPIIVRHTSDQRTTGPRGERVTVAIGGKEVYLARHSGELDMDIAEMLEEHVREWDGPLGDGEVLYVVATAEELERNRVTVTTTDGGSTESASFIAVPGGISVQNMKKFNRTATDIFAGRFFAEGNFFLSTRTAGWKISMRESELWPLTFIRDSQRGAITIVDRLSSNTINIGDPGKGVYSLSIGAVRRKFFDEFNVLPSVFDVYQDSKFCCRIEIEADEPAVERYLVGFTNSLGAFDFVSLDGKMIRKLEPVEDENSTYDSIDCETGSYIRRRLKQTVRQVYELTTGPQRPDRIGLILDMLSNDGVTMDPGTGGAVAVIPTCEELQFACSPTEPSQFTIRFERVWLDSRFTPDIDDTGSSRKPNVFTNKFSDRFK